MENIGIIETPLGFIEIKVRGEVVFSLKIIDKKDIILESRNEMILLVENEIREYFGGKRQKFSFQIFFEIGTDFQKKTWETLLNIPYGETITYKKLAELVGSPKSYRAVGNANNKNPLPIIVPCHRVIGTNNSLVGYAYGLDKKKYLLNLESKKNYICDKF